MIVELTKNEAMWIIDKAVKTCAGGELAISKFTEEQLAKDKDAQKAVKDAKAILDAIARLGMKITVALEKEINDEKQKGVVA